MIRVRGGSGLGDSIYLRPFVEHWIAEGNQVEVCTSFPDVFIGTRAQISPFRRNMVNKVCHYVSGKGRPDTTQWDDLCISGGVQIPMSMQWKVRNRALVRNIKGMADGRPIVLVHGGREPMGRSDGFARDLMPTWNCFSEVLAGLRDCFLVRIGGGESIYELDCDLDLTGRTSVSDMLDLFRRCDGIVAQCSFAVPAAEVFDKPLLAVWAHRAAASSQPYIRTITPFKVLSKPTSRHVMDDWDADKIEEQVHAFRQFL